MKEVAAARVSPKTISALVAWAARYPTGMMFRDPGQAAAILNAAAKTKARMLTTAGIFRNKAAQAWSPPDAADGPDADD